MVNFTLSATSHVRGATSPRKALAGREGYHHPYRCGQNGERLEGIYKNTLEGVIATTQWTVRPSCRGSIPRRGKGFCLLQKLQTGALVPTQWVAEALSLE